MRKTGNGRAIRPFFEKTFCEFFAGIGLVGEGLAASGWKCVYANDIDAGKQELYKARNGNAEHYHLEDVRRTDLIKPNIPGRPFLATASFPCIDLSLAGRYRGLKGRHSSTFFAFVAVLESLAGKPLTGDLVMAEVGEPVHGPWGASWDTEAVGVPRRFGMAVVLLMVTMYAVLFSAMQSLNTHPAVFVVVAILVTGVGLGQILMYEGKHPRAASIWVGACLFPVEMLVVLIRRILFPLI